MPVEELNLEADTFTDEDLKTLAHMYSEADPDVYDPNFFSVPDNSNLRGFFQSVHYFSEFGDQIKKN